MRVVAKTFDASRIPPLNNRPRNVILAGKRYIMSVKDEVLKYLEENRGGFVSGGALAARLGVSRNAIWKAIKALETEGYAIEAVTNRGYRMCPENDILSSFGVKKYLNDQNRDFDIIVEKKITSTNKVLKELAEQGAREGTIIIAGEQSEGRGRYERSFYSPPEGGIYMSILLRPEMTAAESLFLTTAAAVAVAASVDEISGEKSRIKWVNDIFLNGKKICGILTEASLNLENNSLAYAVVGIGINVKEPAGGFPPEISDVAGAIFKNDDPRAAADTRCRLTAEIINRFLGYCRNMRAKTFLREYKRRSMLMGRTVNVFDNVSGTSVPAFVLDIDDDCRLKVKFDDGTIKYLSSGEVSVRI